MAHYRPVMVNRVGFSMYNPDKLYPTNIVWYNEQQQEDHHCYTITATTAPPPTHLHTSRINLSTTVNTATIDEATSTAG